MRPRHLEVEERLRVDVGELLGPPGAGKEAACERCALSSVVPAAKRADHHRALELRPTLDSKLLLPHQPILLSRFRPGPPQCGKHHDRRRPHDAPTASRGGSRARAADASGTGSRRRSSGRSAVRAGRARRAGGCFRATPSFVTSSANAIANTAVARTCTYTAGWNDHTRGTLTPPEWGPAAVASHAARGSSRRTRRPRQARARGATQAPTRPGSSQASSATSTPSASTTIESRKCDPTSQGLSL